jgi:hypothetical protein
MDEWVRSALEKYIFEQEEKINMANGRSHISAGARESFSLAEVQLVGGNMSGMTITASTSIGKHLTDTMKDSGFLHLYNDKESLMIRASQVVAIKLTKLSTE